MPSVFWVAAFVVAIALLFLLTRVLFRPDTSKAAQLMKTYKHLSAELLAATPDDQLVPAVVSNLLAKAEDAKADPYAVIPALSLERSAVYSIWLLSRELHKGDPTALRSSGQFGFSELAADALDHLGETEPAALLRDYLQTADEATAEQMKTMLDEEKLTALLVPYIRENADAFCD